jgi:hypothetical protein
MGMEYDRGPTPEQLRQQRLAQELFADFDRSDFRRELIGQGISYVLVPDDNPIQAEKVISLVEEDRKHGRDMLVIKASRDELGRYTKFVIPATFEQRES